MMNLLHLSNECFIGFSLSKKFEIEIDFKKGFDTMRASKQLGSLPILTFPNRIREKWRITASNSFKERRLAGWRKNRNSNERL
jgi:hypothetical protein